MGYLLLPGLPFTVLGQPLPGMFEGFLKPCLVRGQLADSIIAPGDSGLDIRYPVLGSGYFPAGFFKRCLGQIQVQVQPFHRSRIGIRFPECL